MATTNVTLTKTWTKIADDTDDPVTVSFVSRGPTIEFALMATEVTPSVRGHDAEFPDVITRSAVGDGFLYARCLADGSFSQCRIAVTK